MREVLKRILAEGYGKGLKKLVYSGTVAVKIDGETALRKINIHRHEADRAGMHYNLVCEGVPMGTERWELSVPNGPFKGRYAFVDASGAMSSGEYNEGRLVTRMRDRGIRLDKPDYRLKDRAWLESEVGRDPDRRVVDRPDSDRAHLRRGQRVRQRAHGVQDYECRGHLG